MEGGRSSAMRTPQDGAGWRVSLDLPGPEAIPAFEVALEDLVELWGSALSAFEAEGGQRWRIVLHCPALPDREALAIRIARAAVVARVDPPAFAVEPLAATDWLAEYRRRTRPVRIGRFFVHPSHYTGGVPAGSIGIVLDAGLAFGTGAHASTRGCLLALDAVAADEWTPRRVLDLGCGSGILAIAAAGLWPAARVLAADNDPVAVRVAGENAAANGLAGRIAFAVGEGYGAPGIAAAGLFDLICANILAGPLAAMAGALACHLSAGGIAILGGILAAEADAVITAHEAYGLALTGQHLLGDWATLVLTR